MVCLVEDRQEKIMYVWIRIRDAIACTSFPSSMSSRCKVTQNVSTENRLHIPPFFLVKVKTQTAIHLEIALKAMEEQRR